ncbi:MAG TPA: methyltransferase domain-containing protein, partial [Micromonosporaceae bacterium]|nr:methyltransferase domain-containing protein [Micromonosporaceae bacterium]
AESIPLPDASVDAVVAGQAYHWFDQARAHPEVARVLRPGGTFAAIWNTRDESVAWVAELTRVAHLLDGTGESQPNATSFGPLFGPIERRNFHQSVQHTGESLLALLHSRSYYLTGSPAEQAGIDARVRALVATHPQLAERERFELPYLTEVHRAIRRD